MNLVKLTTYYNEKEEDVYINPALVRVVRADKNGSVITFEREHHWVVKEDAAVVVSMLTTGA